MFGILILLIIGLGLIGCTKQNILPSQSIINGSLAENNSMQEPPIIFNAKIDSLTCKWFVKTGDYDVKSNCIQIISKGTAQGPIGARLELPILAWSDDKFDCGVWTHKTGALVAVGHTCFRTEGQPEQTNWTVDTGTDKCPLKNYFNSDRSHSIKIYEKDSLYAEKEDSKNVQCN